MRTPTADRLFARCLSATAAFSLALLCACSSDGDQESAPPGASNAAAGQAAAGAPGSGGDKAGQGGAVAAGGVSSGGAVAMGGAASGGFPSMAGAPSGGAVGVGGSSAGGAIGMAGSSAGGAVGVAGSSAGGAVGVAGSSAGGAVGMAGSSAGGFDAGGSNGAAGDTGAGGAAAGAGGEVGAGGQASGGATGAGGEVGAGGSASAVCSPACGDGTVCVDGACASSISGDATLDALLFAVTAKMDAEVLLSQQPDLSWKPSSIYHWHDMLEAVATMHTQGVGDLKLWLGDSADGANRYRYAAVNLAAFLAQSMKETIKYDACDENNWDNSNGYKLSNACGQLGQKYEDYDCDMACPKAPGMRQYAVTNARWYGAPGPFFCAPNSDLIAAGLSADGSTGYWDYASDCWPYPATEAGFSPNDGAPYSRPQCEVYAGQKGGRYVFDGSGGSVEGCCWWGRGVIQTTGRCNFGKLNHYLGKTHLPQQPGPAKVMYPDIDFCADPEVICASASHPELKWVAGFFYWMSSVQTYDVGGWNYLAQLRAFVDGGMAGTAFIDSVSGIVNRGCHNPPCASGPVDGGPERAENFAKVLAAFGLP